MIYILTGAIRSGKTTALLKWISNRNDVDGLLCPDGKNGKRYFLKIKSKEEFELEVESENEKVVEIGNFKFLKSAFNEANDYLISTNSKNENKYLIIDEIGKLELKHKGLHKAAEELIPDYIFNDDKHLILIVRTSLVKEVINQSQIKACTLITKEDLELLN